jgi:hypothetical protein
MRRSLAVSLVLLALLRAPALAQTCLGLASYSEAPLQVTGNGWVSSEASSLGAGLRYGRPNSVLAGVAIGTSSNDALGGSTLELGATLGYQIPLGNTARFHLCPVATFGLGIGPKNTFGSGVDRSNQSMSMGVALGTSLPAGPRVKLIPTVGLAYAYRRDQAENSAGASLFEITSHYARLQLGVGLLLSSNLSVRPNADISIGPAGSDPAFGIVLGYNFGISKRSPVSPTIQSSK